MYCNYTSHFSQNHSLARLPLTPAFFFDADWPTAEQVTTRQMGLGGTGTPIPRKPLNPKSKDFGARIGTHLQGIAGVCDRHLLFIEVPAAALSRDLAPDARFSRMSGESISPSDEPCGDVEGEVGGLTPSEQLPGDGRHGCVVGAKR
jgi:hypothetical protein